MALIAAVVSSNPVAEAQGSRLDFPATKHSVNKLLCFKQYRLEGCLCVWSDKRGRSLIVVIAICLGCHGHRKQGRRCWFAPASLRGAVDSIACRNFPLHHQILLLISINSNDDISQPIRRQLPSSRAPVTDPPETFPTCRLPRSAPSASLHPGSPTVSSFDPRQRHLGLHHSDQLIKCRA